ncbi:MAG TPA: flagellar basal body rod C-terminal domain-containing protein [Devosia sp.]
MSALSIAAGGMNAAAARFERNATNITRAGAGTPLGQGVDIAAEMVDMLMNQTQFEVLANVARRAGDMQKHAIDILA